MLRIDRGDQAWFVTQPHHAELAGYLAAHWGNREFVRLGHFAPTPDPERLRAEAVLGIAQHDNGWWEWDAAPRLREADGLPLGLAEVLKNQREGMDRWRLGVPRFGEAHPYAALLIGCHAFWLHAPRVGTGLDPAFRHPLYAKAAPAELAGEEAAATRAFLAELEALQSELRARIRADAALAAGLEPEHLNPHVRLLQLLDGLSLSLCAAVIAPLEGRARGLGEDAFELPEVPRRGWADRVTVALRPSGGGRIVCRPFPFDPDPLPVVVPARVLDLRGDHPSPFETRWHAVQPEPLRFAYCSV